MHIAQLIRIYAIIKIIELLVKSIGFSVPRKYYSRCIVIECSAIKIHQASHHFPIARLVLWWVHNSTSMSIHNISVSITWNLQHQYHSHWTMVFRAFMRKSKSTEKKIPWNFSRKNKHSQWKSQCLTMTAKYHFNMLNLNFVCNDLMLKRERAIHDSRCVFMQMNFERWSLSIKKNGIFAIFPREMKT